MGAGEWSGSKLRLSRLWIASASACSDSGQLIIFSINRRALNTPLPFRVLPQIESPFFLPSLLIISLLHGFFTSGGHGRCRVTRQQGTTPRAAQR